MIAFPGAKMPIGEKEGYTRGGISGLQADTFCYNFGSSWQISATKVGYVSSARSESQLWLRHDKGDKQGNGVGR